MKNIIITERQYHKLMEDEDFDEWMRKQEEEQKKRDEMRQYRNLSLDGKIDYFIDKKPHAANIREIPNIIFLDDYDVKQRHFREFCEEGRCETNVFGLVKRWPERYTIIGGFAVSFGSAVEHWWAYDKEYGGQYIEPTPNFKRGFDGFYMGVPLPHLNDAIVQADNQWDIDELKGGNVYEKYFKKYMG